jgi:hypothetical protein
LKREKGKQKTRVGEEIIEDILHAVSGSIMSEKIK